MVSVRTRVERIVVGCESERECLLYLRATLRYSTTCVFVFVCVFYFTFRKTKEEVWTKTKFIKKTTKCTKEVLQLV